MYSTEERERIANALESENPASLLKLYRIVLGEGEKNNTTKLFKKLADLIRDDPSEQIVRDDLAITDRNHDLELSMLKDVPDAYGTPIKEGDTVWCIRANGGFGHGPYTVENVYRCASDIGMSTVLFTDGHGTGCQNVTHEPRPKPDATADCGGWHVEVHDPGEVLTSPSNTAQEVAGMMASGKHKCCDCRYFTDDTDTLTMGVCFMKFNMETMGYGYSLNYRPACEKFDKKDE